MTREPANRVQRPSSPQIFFGPLVKQASFGRSRSNDSLTSPASVQRDNRDNVRVCARFRPLSSIEEEINDHLAAGGLKDSVFECITFPDNPEGNAHQSVELHVPDGVLLAAERYTGQASMSLPAESLSEKDIERFVFGAVGGVGGAPGAAPIYLSRAEEGDSVESLSNVSQGSQMLYNSTAISHYKFVFSRVFSQETSQQEIYEDIGLPIVEDVIQGYNGTIFVYGQTSSGKTHTMLGAQILSASRAGTPQRRRFSAPGDPLHTAPFSPAGSNFRVNPYNQEYVDSQVLAHTATFDVRGEETAGLIPRVVRGLFDAMYASPETTSFTVTMSFVEIYMEHVRDLLVPDPTQSALNVREDPRTSSFYVEGCVTPEVTRVEEILQLLEFGITARATACTKMNIASSRSHCLLCLVVRSHDSTTLELKTGKLYLVDLAGSEKVSKTRAEGQQLEEAKIINKSLTTLGQVITSLTDTRPRSHIPYRDSKLTKILQEALGGNSRTTLVVCCSPSVRNAYETLSTLRFGQRAKTIRNRAVINKEFTMDELKLMLDAARREIDQLRTTQQPEGISTAPVESQAEADRQTVEQQREIIEQLQQKLHLAQTRFIEERQRLVCEVKDLREQLEGAVQGQHAKARTQLRLTELVRELTAEVASWEHEYIFLRREHESTLLQLKAAHSAVREFAQSHDQFISSTTQRRQEVVELHTGLDAALRICRAQIDKQQSLAQSAETAELTSDGVSRAAFDRKETGEVNNQLRSAEYDKATIDFLTERVRLVEDQRSALEASVKELLGENKNLNLELQLLTKRMEIRTERVENLKQGMRDDHQAFIEMRTRYEGELDLERERVVDARREIEDWKHKTEQLALQFRLTQPEYYTLLAGGADGATPLLLKARATSARSEGSIHGHGRALLTPYTPGADFSSAKRYKRDSIDADKDNILQGKSLDFSEEMRKSG